MNGDVIPDSNIVINHHTRMNCGIVTDDGARANNGIRMNL